MCTPKEVQERFIDDLTKEIEFWFKDFVEMDKENLAEGLLTEEEVVARMEVLEDCARFMKTIFIKLSTGIDIEGIEEQ